MEEIKPINLESEEGVGEGVGVKAGVEVEKKKKVELNKKMVLTGLGIVVLGIVSGYGLYRVKQPTSPRRLTAKEGEVEKGTTVGIMDEETFSDMAEGELAKGGVNGEGSHHLVREGGESQYVYLTSSILDLDKFVGRKVKVWGETFEAQKAGWLMDIGRLEVQ